MKNNNNANDPEARTWNMLYNWSMKHMEPQGNEKKSIFHGQSPEEIQAGIELINKVMKENTINIGELLKTNLQKIVDHSTGKEKLNRSQLFEVILKIDDVVENLDFADIFYRLNGLQIIYKHIISNENFEHEDIKIFSGKIIGNCLNNTKDVNIDFPQSLELFKLLFEKLKTLWNKPQFSQAIFYTLSCLISSNLREKEIYSSYISMIMNSFDLLLMILEKTEDFNLEQKVLHFLLSCYLLIDRNEPTKNNNEKRIREEFTFKLVSSTSPFLSICKKKILENFEKGMKTERKFIVLVEKYLFVLKEIFNDLKNNNKEPIVKMLKEEVFNVLKKKLEEITVRKYLNKELEEEGNKELLELLKETFKDFL